MIPFSDRDVLADGRHAGLVRRYHAWSMHQSQSVGEHSWQMWRIYRLLWGVPPAAVAELIMTHDAGEIGTGDMPLYAKRDDPLLKERMDIAEVRAQQNNGLVATMETTERQKWRVKATDLIEGLEHCLVEIQRGNQFAVPAQQNYTRALSAHLEKLERDHEDRLIVRAHCRGLEGYHIRIMAAGPHSVIG